MFELFEDFTYGIEIRFVNLKTNKKTIKYITEVNYCQKTFVMKTEEEIDKEGLEILAMKKNQAIELMNCLFCNGYLVSMFPYFKKEQPNEE